MFFNLIFVRYINNTKNKKEKQEKNIFFVNFFISSRKNCKNFLPGFVTT